MKRTVHVVSATCWRHGQCVGLAGIGDGERGIVALGSCDIPLGVGARGGRLARVASKLARSKALKRIARAALEKAARMNPAQASGALVIARTALDAAKRLDREARADREPDDAPPPPEVEAEEYEYDAP